MRIRYEKEHKMIISILFIVILYGLWGDEEHYPGIDPKRIDDYD